MSKVLIVDDEIFCRLLLEQMINCYDKDITVKSTSTAEEALRMISYENPDLVFVDLQMPVIDGERLCAIIRENEKNRNIKIIVTTAMQLNVVKYADAVINKPFTLKDIINVCDSNLVKSNAADKQMELHHKMMTRMGKNA